jgi:hypothetical protein
MFTVVAYWDAVAKAALAPIAGVGDPHVRVVGNDIWIPPVNSLIAAMAGGIAVTEARLDSPSMRKLSNQRISPVALAILPMQRLVDFDGNISFVNDWLAHPRVLDEGEALEALAINGGATDEWVVAFLQDKPEPLPAGSIISVWGTVTLVGVLGVWVNGAIIFQEVLPAGRYAVVGMRVEDPACVAARLVLSASFWRPGCMGCNLPDDSDHPNFRYGKMGSWGEFEQLAPPTMDILANAPGALTAEVVMDLVQVRAGSK